MVTLLEDLIRLLDRTSDGYRHGRRPGPAEAATVTTVLRAVLTTSTAEASVAVLTRRVGALPCSHPGC